MRIIKTAIFFLIIFVINNCVAQKVTKDQSSPSNIVMLDKEYIYINGPYFQYNSNFKIKILQNIILESSIVGGDNPFQKSTIHGHRKGLCQNNMQIGEWITSRYYNSDSLSYPRMKRYVIRKEYFKNGLRDGEYKIYNKKGNIIYSTNFKNGTGLEKDFHENEKLYYEIATKDGYFTDTLKLYNNKGRLQKKLLYKKDSLVYNKEFDTNIVDTIENGKKVKITYKNNEFERKEFGNETWFYKENKVNLKSKDTIINGIKKRYQDYINGESLTKTIYIINNPTIDYESIFRYSKEILRSQINVFNDKYGNPQETETRFDEKGNLESIINRNHKAYLYIKENYVYEKKDYYKSGKKYQYSELIYKENKILKDVIKNDEQIQFRELNYYTLRKELVKKEYIKNTSGLLGGGCEVPKPYEITEIEKIEYFDKNKLVKIEYFDKNKLIKTEENKNN